MQYALLVRILDQLRTDAPSQLESRYRPDPIDLEKVNQARSRAFIHLYLKVMFGLTEFSERERTITDGSYDGGVDAYYINQETRTVYFIQSKFRTTEKNFQAKEILLEELLSMDVNRILDGEQTDEIGNAYNGKIKQLQREVSGLPDIARYSYQIVLLANLQGVSPSKLRQLAGGISVTVFDFAKTYAALVFPVITGTYFAASDILLPIDLSNKNAGSKISYNVSTKFGHCEITVLFVPTFEIAAMMHKYKNTILRFNPRSYLDLEGHAVHDAIKTTIMNTNTNEFALFNNGITMLSEETNINEKIGQKNKAQLRVKNPQIINGGQTSFTLSRIYARDVAAAPKIFEGKEVLLKVITLLDDNSDDAKIELIDEISNATNKQTPVINADRFANEAFHVQVQKAVFERFGLMYERKRGEFSDGVHDGYVNASEVIERNLFWRLYFSANGQIQLGTQRRLFQGNRFPGVDVSDTGQLDRLRLAVAVFRQMKKDWKPYSLVGADIYCKVFAYITMFYRDPMELDPAVIDANLLEVYSRWQDFMDTVKSVQEPGPGRRQRIDANTGEVRYTFSEKKYLRSGSVAMDIQHLFRTN